MAGPSEDTSLYLEDHQAVRPMFAAKHAGDPAGDADAAPESQYVLFEQAPLRGPAVLQGAATRKLHTLWARQDRTHGLPVLSAFDSSHAADMLPYLVIHQVHYEAACEFELVYAGQKCCEIMGMSPTKRRLKPTAGASNTSDVHARLLDVVRHQHPHFCVKTLGWQGRDMTKYEALLLPFGEEGFEGVVAILSVLNFSSNFDPKYWMSREASAQALNP